MAAGTITNAHVYMLGGEEGKEEGAVNGCWNHNKRTCIHVPCCPGVRRPGGGGSQQRWPGTLGCPSPAEPPTSPDHQPV